MKRLSSVLLVLLLCCAMALPALAADAPRFWDNAGLVPAAQADAIAARLDAISTAHSFDFDVAIVTVDTLSGEDPELAAEWLYDEYGYGMGKNHDGVLLLINIGERDWVITSTGYGQTVINEDARDYLSNAILPDLSAGRYASAFQTFADETEALLAQAEAGTYYKEPFNFGKSILTALFFGLVLAIVVVSIMKRKLKSVAMQAAATNYVVPGSLHVTLARERFLYSRISRTARAKDNDSHGGGSHSSSSGKF